ncbi:MAG: DUF3570 domain-containing protein [Flavobacteriales bacterium]|nr:DUF3570 domain-containing protein [Flavobacteriales bacterium]
MMRLFLIFFTISSLTFAQEAIQDTAIIDTGYQKIKLKKHQIKAVFGFLGQDGDHSAVTGGEGTEELHVQSARIIYLKKTKKNNQWNLKGGIDQITSASTDRIDFIKSSASYHDLRGQVNIGFAYSDSTDTNTYIGVIGSSLESDYWSRQFGVKYKRKTKYGGIIQLKLNYNWDELRWGIITAGIFDFTKMVYPSELRGTNWFNKSHRNSLTLSSKYTLISSQRSRLGVMFDFTIQEGILSTPFHRVYFNNGDLRVERLPFKRVKLPLSVQYNYFISNGLIIKNYFRYYWDSFGMNSYTFSLQAPIKVKYWLWLKPFLRFYHQSGINYFKPYANHSPSQRYYTSDYDLSKFNSLNYGLSLKVKKRPSWDRINGYVFNFENYLRSDGLSFWQTSFKIDVSF